LRGAEQAAGRVEFDHQRARVMRVGVGDRILDKRRDRRVDRAFDPYQANPRRGRDAYRRMKRGGRRSRAACGAVVVGSRTGEPAEREHP